MTRRGATVVVIVVGSRTSLGSTTTTLCGGHSERVGGLVSKSTGRVESSQSNECGDCYDCRQSVPINKMIFGKKKDTNAFFNFQKRNVCSFVKRATTTTTEEERNKRKGACRAILVRQTQLWLRREKKKMFGLPLQSQYWYRNTSRVGVQCKCSACEDRKFQNKLPVQQVLVLGPKYAHTTKSTSVML